MIVRRVLNDNVVDGLDDALQEVIVFGKGLGFNSKPGELIDESLIEKIFRLDDKEANKIMRKAPRLPGGWLILEAGGCP